MIKFYTSATKHKINIMNNELDVVVTFEVDHQVLKYHVTETNAHFVLCCIFYVNNSIVATKEVESLASKFEILTHLFLFLAYFSFGFVDFASQEDQKKAIELTGTDLYGRELNITPSNSRSGGGDRGRGRGGARGGGRGGGQRTPNRERNPPSNTLFVKNLSFGTTEDTLYEHFDGASRIRIITDRESGESRG